jgi:fatty acid desaturase
MAAAARIDPKTVFTPEEWAGLQRRSSWRGVGLILHAWALILGAGALFVVWPNPLTYVLAVMIIGARQLGLAILQHDAAHGALHPDQKVNDWLGEWLCGAAVGSSLKRYRPYHLQHHKYTEQPEDPDLALSRPFPVTAQSLRRKIVRDLTGQTFFKQRIQPFLMRFQGRKPPPARVKDNPGFRFWLVNGAAIALSSAAGLWWAWPALWIVPMATWLPLVTRLRNIAEHACLSEPDNPWRHARTTRANFLERLFIAPYAVHFHAEHHMWMYVPCYHLERAHKILTARGFTDRMEIADGYASVLRKAASKPASAPIPA